MMARQTLVLTLVLLNSLAWAPGSAGEPPQADAPREADVERDEAQADQTPAPERPVSVQADESFIFPPAPMGIPTRAVPAIVSEPPHVSRVSRTAPLMPEHEGIYAVDVPKPAKRRPKGRGAPMNQAVVLGPVQPAPAPVAITSGIEAEPTEPFAPALLTSFDSLEFDDNSPNSGSFFIPPDPHGAAGSDHVVSVTNTSLQFHTKTGTPLLDSDLMPGVPPFTGQGLASFFFPLAPLTATFDPKVLYDQFADRWVIVALEQTDTLFGDPADTSQIFVAVSDTGDPTGMWTMAAINSAMVINFVNSWADFPGFAVDEDALYITANMFDFFTTGAAFQGVRLWIIDKGLGTGGFYDGGAASVTVHDPYASAGIATTTQPAHVYCNPAWTCPSPAGTYLVSYSGLTNGFSEFLQFVRVDDPVGTPVFNQQFLNIGDIEDFAAAFPLAPQSGSTFPIATNDRRALDAVWRDDDSLWMTATIDPNAATSAADAGEATAVFWELDTSNADPSFASLTQQALISGDADIATDAHTFFPSIAVNAAGDVGIGFSASAASIFAGSYYTTQALDDTLGTTTSAMVLRAGVAAYERTFDNSANDQCDEVDSRWGDYSAAALDPEDQCFWIYNQHAITKGTVLAGDCPLGGPGGPDMGDGTEDGRWGTAFGKVCVDCQTSPLTVSTTTAGVRRERAADIVIEGTADVLGGGDLTLEGQVFEFQNGFTVIGDLSVFSGFCPPP